MKKLFQISAGFLLAGALVVPAVAESSNESDDFREISLAEILRGRLANDQCESGKEDNSSSRHGNRFRTLQVVGLTSDNRLVCFNEYAPKAARNIGFVSNLSGGDTALIGIDFRVQNGLLYGVGNKGGVYQIDTSNAVATLVNRLSVALDDSTAFGVDFNPAADRLRIVSSKGQNLRHNVNAGGITLNDGAVNYPAATPISTRGPNALGIVGAAYTNNDLNADTATTLYALDSTLDQIAIQSPANDGTLAATGKLRVNASEVAGFDIYSKIRDGVTTDVQALASIKTAEGAMGLYSVKLPTGKASLRGSFADQVVITDIAIPLNQL